MTTTKSHARLRHTAVGGLAKAVSVLAAIAALVLAAHVAFVAFEANQDNPIVQLFRDAADPLAWQFQDLFTPEREKVRVAVNYGLAAVVYLVVGNLLAKAIRRAD